MRVNFLFVDQAGFGEDGGVEGRGMWPVAYSYWVYEKDKNAVSQLFLKFSGKIWV